MCRWKIGDTFLMHVGVQDNIKITFSTLSIPLPELPKQVISSQALNYPKLSVLEISMTTEECLKLYIPKSMGLSHMVSGLTHTMGHTKDFFSSGGLRTLRSPGWLHFYGHIYIFVLNLYKVGLFLSINLLRLDNRNWNPVQEGNQLELWKLKSNNTACSGRISTKIFQLSE